MEAVCLELPFSTKEVLASMRDMNGDKALGLDGFTTAFSQSAFSQSSWEVVKDNVMRMFKELHESSKFVKSLNNSFIVMIPKKRKRGGGGGGVVVWGTLQIKKGYGQVG